jgi:hypothetical protein
LMEAMKRFILPRLAPRAIDRQLRYSKGYWEAA